MSEVSTRAWTRPHDWAEVVIGAVAALSPLWLSTDTTAMWTLVVLGALIALDGLASLAVPGAVYGEGIKIALGVLFFIAPWGAGLHRVGRRVLDVLDRRSADDRQPARRRCRSQRRRTARRANTDQLA